jgi:hypothetical protein
MGRHRYRTVYYATGMPGWMRPGPAPGWMGAPPCCAPPCVGPGYWAGVPEPVMNKEDEVALLEEQAEMLEIDLQEIRKRIEQLKK